MADFFLLNQFETTTLTIPQASSIFSSGLLSDDAAISGADGSAILGGFHWSYEEDAAVITIPQACSVFGVPFLDDAAAISGADGAHLLGGYRYNYSLTPEVIPPDEAKGPVAYKSHGGRRSRYYELLKELMRPVDPEPPAQDKQYDGPDRNFSYLADVPLDFPSDVPHTSSVDWLALIPGQGISEEQKRRIAIAYLMLE